MSSLAAHHLFIGETSSGKSWEMMKLSQMFYPKKRAIVLTDDLDKQWEKQGKPIFATSDTGKFIDYAKKHQNLVLNIEEGATSIGKNPSKEEKWLFTGSRHNGHVAALASQEYTNFSTVIRGNVQFLHIFKTGENSAEALYGRFRKDFLKNVPSLPFGVFYYYDSRRGFWGLRRSYVPGDTINKALERIKTEDGS